MATKLYFHAAAADYATGTNDPDLSGTARPWDARLLDTAQGASLATVSTNTVTGPTAGVEVQPLGAVFPAVWYSRPLDAGVTISGSITWNIWAAESNMSANVAINGRLEVIDGATGAITLIDQTVRTTEVAVTTRAANNFAETPAAGVSCKRGDRLRVRIFGDDQGANNMASTYTFSISYDGPTPSADGDTWLQLTENLTFVSEPTGTTVYPTNTVSDVSTASWDREAWTERGAGVQDDVTNTQTGWVSPIHVTTTAGGGVVDWFTRPLVALTLGGAVRVNARALESSINANATLRCEIARVAADGTSPSVWGATTAAVELGTSEAALSFLVSGDDLAVATGERLRIRFYVDNMPLASMGASQTVTLYYAGTSGGASGDTYLTFTQTLTESSNDKSGSGTLSTSASFASAGTKADSGTGSLTPTASFARAGAKAGAGAGGALALTATLAGAGNAAEAHSGSGSLSLSASLSSAGLKAGAGTGSLSTSASLGQAGAKAGAGVGTLSLSASLASAGQKAFEATGSLTLSATLARAGQKGGQDSGAISLTLGFAATGGPSAEAHSGSGTLSLSASLAGSATKAGAGTGAVGLTASLARAGAKTGQGAGTLPLAPSFSSAGNEAAQSSGALTLAPTISGVGTKAGAGAGTVALSLALSGSGSGPVAASGSGTLELTLTFAANGKAGRPGGYVPYEPALPYIPRIAKRGSGRLRLYVGLAGNGHKTGATGHGELVAVLGATTDATKAVAGAGEALEPYLVAWGVGYGDGDTVRALRAELARAYVRIAQLEAEVEALEAMLAVA